MNSYEHAMSVLALCRAKKSFDSWLKKAETAAGKHDIASYLIVPIQRLPRYVLLLQDLISLTEETHIDYQHLCEALTSTKQVAEYVNEQKKKVCSVHWSSTTHHFDRETH